MSSKITATWVKYTGKVLTSSHNTNKILDFKTPQIIAQHTHTLSSSNLFLWASRMSELAVGMTPPEPAAAAPGEAPVFSSWEEAEEVAVRSFASFSEAALIWGLWVSECVSVWVCVCVWERDIYYGPRKSYMQIYNFLSKHTVHGPKRTRQLLMWIYVQHYRETCSTKVTHWLTLAVRWQPSWWSPSQRGGTPGPGGGPPAPAAGSDDSACPHQHPVWVCVCACVCECVRVCACVWENDNAKSQRTFRSVDLLRSKLKHNTGLMVTRISRADNDSDNSRTRCQWWPLTSASWRNLCTGSCLVMNFL